jgi:ATP-binding cassette subfamily B protein
VDLAGDVALETVASATVTAGIFLVAALHQRWDLALVVLACVPALGLVNRLLERPNRRAARAERMAFAQVTSTVEDDLGQIRVIQAYNAESRARQGLHTHALQLLRARMREHWVAGVQAPVVELLETLGVIVVLGLGTVDVVAGRLTTGGLLAFAAYLGFLYPPLTALGQIRLDVSGSLPAAERLQELLDTHPEVDDPATPASLPEGPLTLRIENVSYTPNTAPLREAPGASDPGRCDPVDHASVRARLHGIHLTVATGELLPVTGPSGSGKSTLAELLVRFHDPTCGRIALGDVDLRDLSLANVRDAVTLLPQDIALPAGRIHDNLIYASPEAASDAVHRAMTLSGLGKLIAELPEMDTARTRNCWAPAACTAPCCRPTRHRQARPRSPRSRPVGRRTVPRDRTPMRERHGLRRWDLYRSAGSRVLSRRVGWCRPRWRAPRPRRRRGSPASGRSARHG